jgi:hypothetical protein
MEERMILEKRRMDCDPESDVLYLSFDSPGLPGFSNFF